MQVQNYYQMDEEALEEKLNELREWLFEYEGHPQYQRALFAFKVILSARELKRDEFTRACITHLT